MPSASTGERAVSDLECRLLAGRARACPETIVSGQRDAGPPGVVESGSVPCQRESRSYGGKYMPLSRDEW